SPRCWPRKGRKPMSDHMLSQEEVDALLRGEAGGAAEELPDLDAVTRLFQRAFDQVAPLAPPIAGQRLETGQITAELLPWGELRGVQLSVADASSRQQLKAYLDEEDPVTVLNKLALALSETLVQTLGAKTKPDISSYQEVDPEQFDPAPLRDKDTCVVLQLSLRGDKGDVSWLEVVPAQLARDMLALAERAAPAAEVPAAEAPAAPGPAAPPQAASAQGVSVAPATFEQLAPMPADPEPANIGLIMDVPLHVTV